ncbi:MAG: glutaredoxin family protein [Eubacteriaceae bacterium]|nr:glutaredoxin family protein [Eubacteriaceae bacterium]
MKQIIIYTTSKCKYSKMAKKFLDENKIPYVEKDINKDKTAKEEHSKLNLKGVPVFVIGNEVIWGFDKEKLLKFIK